MKLSTKGRYGIKAMLDLALHYGMDPISIKSISKRQNISEYYLEQLFSNLRKANLIKSVRGAQGGYSLEKSPSETNVFEIMEILEGPIEVSECIELENCSNINCCATRLLWVKIKDSIDNVMKSTSLQDMVDDNNNMQKEKNDE